MMAVGSLGFPPQVGSCPQAKLEYIDKSVLTNAVDSCAVKSAFPACASARVLHIPVRVVELQMSPEISGCHEKWYADRQCKADRSGLICHQSLRPRSQTGLVVP
jgi:hypothetical protein